MADTERHLFGLHISDYVQKVTEDGTPILQGGATVTFTTDLAGSGTYTNFTADKAGTIPIDAVTTSSGGNGYQLGDMTGFYGPPGVKWMVASVDGGPRRVVWCTDLAEIVDQAIPESTVLARGDLLAGVTGGEIGRLPIGANGRVLTTDDTQATGMRWAIPAGGGSVITDAQSDTLWVAALDAPDDFGEGDYNCDGISDEVEINTALANPFGLRVGLSPGTFQLAGPVQLLGNDNAAVPRTRALRGAGPYASTLVAASGIAGAVYLGNAVCPQVADLGIVVAGTSHAVYSTASATPAAGKRSFWHGELRNLLVKGPNNGTHTGWVMSLAAGFRYAVTGVEATGVGNGLRVLNSDATVNAGACEFRRINLELIGSGATAVHVSSPTGGANQVLFDTVTASVAAASTSTVGYRFDGAGATSGVRVRGCTADNFDTVVSVGASASDIDVDLTRVTMTTGATFAAVAGYSNRVRGVLTVPASAAVTAISDTNGLTSKPNRYEVDITADTGSTVTAALLSGVVERGVATGAGVVAGVLKQGPQRWQPLLFGYKGTISAPGSGGFPIWNNSGGDLVLKSVQYSRRTGTTTGTSVVDVNVNDVSVFTNPANKPTIAAAGTTSGQVTAGINGVVWPAGAKLTVDIDTVGDGTGTDPVVQVDHY